MTIYDIAKRAGVSASTVSRVLNNRPGINKATREKVKMIVKETNFSVSEAARGLVNQNSSMIGILVADIRNQHHIEGAYMMERHFLEKGYCSLIMNTGEDPEKKAGYIRILASRRVNAVVLVGSAFQNDLVKEAIENYMPDTPIVFQNGYFDLDNVSSVIADEYTGTKEAVEYLYGRGRRHIAFINNNDTPSNRNKKEGYVSAIKQYGISERMIFRCQDSADGGACATAELLNEYPDTDAIIYSVDILGVGGSRMILDMGLRIPEDIAIIGTDNSPYSLISNPRLSTIDTKLCELSASCYEILSKAIEQPNYQEHRVISPSLVLRETT